MPWLPLYLFGDDFDILLKILNDDPEIAFIVSGGERRWKAVKSLSAFAGERYTLWHIPGGPLPLLASDFREPFSLITDPWQGWTERRSCADPRQPFFGPFAPQVFWLNLWRGDEKTIKLSSFEWVGNDGAEIGASADKLTERWWKRLRATAKRLSTKVPRGGPQSNSKPEIYALAGAMRALEEGKVAEINPGF